MSIARAAGSDKLDLGPKDTTSTSTFENPGVASRSGGDAIQGRARAEQLGSGARIRDEGSTSRGGADPKQSADERPPPGAKISPPGGSGGGGGGGGGGYSNPNLKLGSDTML